MAQKRMQGLILDAGEPFRINDSVFVMDGMDIVTLEAYQHRKDRPRPLCALCDTDRPVHICAECSKRLFEEPEAEDAVDPQATSTGTPSTRV